jgi:hypothetical protein
MLGLFKRKLNKNERYAGKENPILIYNLQKAEEKTFAIKMI